jgi:hypothetical protein
MWIYVPPEVRLISQIHKFVNLGSYRGCRAVNTARIQTVRLTAAVVSRSAVDLIIRTVSNPAQVVNGGRGKELIRVTSTRTHSSFQTIAEYGSSA